jgi:hypothetical protein
MSQKSSLPQAAISISQVLMSDIEGSEPFPRPAEFCPNTDFFKDCLSEILRHRGVVPTD